MIVIRCMVIAMKVEDNGDKIILSLQSKQSFPILCAPIKL